MTIDMVVAISQDTLYTIIKCSAPMLLVSLIVGLIVSIFQTVTSIQEQTLTFVPKILSVFIILMIVGHWVLNTMTEYIINLWSNIGLYIQ
jgi:flagellar biosynthetic protein FliQ